MSDHMQDAIEDAAVALFSRGDAGLEFSDDPDVWRHEAKVAVEAARPHIEATLIERMLEQTKPGMNAIRYFLKNYRPEKHNSSALPTSKEAN